MPTLIGLLGTCGIIALILAARQIRAMHDEDMSVIQGDCHLDDILLSAGWPPVANGPHTTEGARQGRGREVSRQVVRDPNSVLHGSGEL